jgi:hypothetical protein
MTVRGLRTVAPVFCIDLTFIVAPAFFIARASFIAPAFRIAQNSLTAQSFQVAPEFPKTSESPIAPDFLVDYLLPTGGTADTAFTYLAFDAALMEDMTTFDLY